MVIKQLFNPIFMKDEKEDPDNYRPVNLTSGPGKVMKVILEVTVKHLRGNTVTGYSQHRFMSGKSCLTILIPFYDKGICLGDQGKPVDFSKTFDTVSHSILLVKTYSIWLGKSIIHWMSNWLMGRLKWL